MLTATRHLVSIGRAARDAHTDVDRYAEAAGKIGVQAAQTIDGVPLLDRDDARRVQEHIEHEAREVR